MKIGITGQSGFIGTHLFNYFGLFNEVERIPFKDEYFDSKANLENFVRHCDTIVHLAAMNRHDNPQVIYNTNIRLVKMLIDACEATESCPHILFSSSTQEGNDNLYGKSKYDGRELLGEWANRNSSIFTGLIIPNVFGPFGSPYHNSFIATFCYQTTHDKIPKIKDDSKVKLIYVGELVKEIFQIIIDAKSNGNTKGLIKEHKVSYTSQIRVSEVLKLVINFKEDYLKHGILPNLNTEFEKNLFNTFICYIDHKKIFPFYLKKYSDNRGSFVEILKLNSGGQVSFSSTVSGITRGNHYHTRKAERFSVIKGKARIELRKVGTQEIISFELDGDNPSFVDMPIWYTHNITNIGGEVLYTVFWISEHYNPKDKDTYFEVV